MVIERERNVLFNDALNTFYLRLYTEREMFYLTTYSTHFIYGYMASDILWLRTILIVRKETCCRHIGYSFRLTARVLLYAPSHRQDSTTTAFVTSVVEHWMEREIAQWVHPTKDRSDDPSHHERTLLLRSYISLHIAKILSWNDSTDRYKHITVSNNIVFWTV